MSLSTVPKGNIKIYSIYKASIDIQNTLFYNGNDTKGGGLYIYQISEKEANRLRLVNCNFIRNRAKTGSHIMIETNKNMKSIGDKNAFLITNCTFMHGIGNNSFGVVFLNQGKKAFNIIIQYSNFTDNENGALAINSYKNTSKITVNIRLCFVTTHKL